MEKKPEQRRTKRTITHTRAPNKNEIPDGKEVMVMSGSFLSTSPSASWLLFEVISGVISVSSFFGAVASGDSCW